MNDVHYYIAKEYVSQLMKKKYSCKKPKNEDAAIKMKEQWNELRKLFVEMVRYSPVSNSVKYNCFFQFRCTENILLYLGIILKVALSTGKLP